MFCHVTHMHKHLEVHLLVIMQSARGGYSCLDLIKKLMLQVSLDDVLQLTPYIMTFSRPPPAAPNALNSLGRSDSWSSDDSWSSNESFGAVGSHDSARQQQRDNFTSLFITPSPPLPPLGETDPSLTASLSHMQVTSASSAYCCRHLKTRC